MLVCHRFKAQKLLLAIGFILAIEGLLVPMSAFSTTPPPPSSTGRPGSRTAAGGHRGQCPEVNPALTAIVPLTEAKTIAQRPTFWFYTPYNNSILTAKFTLEENDEIITEIPAHLPTTPGLMQVKLPDSITLEMNRSYRWVLQVNCASTQVGQPSVFVEGMVRRVLPPPNVKQQLAITTANASQQQIALLKANQLWLDAVAILLEQQVTTTQSDSTLTAEWKKLLSSLDLPQLIEIPLVPINK